MDEVLFWHKVGQQAGEFVRFLQSGEARAYYRSTENEDIARRMDMSRAHRRAAEGLHNAADAANRLAGLLDANRVEDF